MSDELYDINDLERNERKLIQSVPRSGRIIAEDFIVVNEADLIKAEIDKLAPKEFLQATDSSDASIEYYGFAEPASLASQSVWRIIRLDNNGKRYANNNPAFVHEWDERENYTYDPSI